MKSGSNNMEEKSGDEQYIAACPCIRGSANFLRAHKEKELVMCDGITYNVETITLEFFTQHNVQHWITVRSIAVGHAISPHWKMEGYMNKLAQVWPRQHAHEHCSWAPLTRRWRARNLAHSANQVEREKIRRGEVKREVLRYLGEKERLYYIGWNMADWKLVFSILQNSLASWQIWGRPAVKRHTYMKRGKKKKKVSNGFHLNFMNPNAVKCHSDFGQQPNVVFWFPESVNSAVHCSR